MGAIKLRKNASIGQLAAEHDQAALGSAFVDLGYLQTVTDTQNPSFLILGRTGSGKTAILERIKQLHPGRHSVVAPEELSMQYLYNSGTLRALLRWGVNLEVFLKYLWRHICILELIRLRYGDTKEVPSSIAEIFSLESILKPQEKATREAAQKYVAEYGNEYWVRSDTRIKKLIEDFEGRLANADGLADDLGGQKEPNDELRSRAQEIVSDYLIADLNHVVKLLGQYGFADQKQRYYLLVDDLDREWMPDDNLYLELLKSLLFTVRDVNQRFPAAKVIVALRENIYHRLFRAASRHEPQREKWRDVQVRLSWNRKELTQLLQDRLGLLFREHYTKEAPSLRDVLPKKTKKTPDPIDFIVDRTLMRPRDAIDFMNTYLEKSEWGQALTWTSLFKAELEYSRRRLQSVFDEWADNFFGLPALNRILNRVPSTFRLGDISEEVVLGVFEHERREQCPWLGQLYASWVESRITLDDVKAEFVRVLYLVGILGAEAEGIKGIVYSFEQPMTLSAEALSKMRLHLHRMFWSAFGKNQTKRAGVEVAFG